MCKSSRQWPKVQQSPKEKRSEEVWQRHSNWLFESVAAIQKFKVTIRQSRIAKAGIKLSDCQSLGSGESIKRWEITDRKLPKFRGGRSYKGKKTKDSNTQWQVGGDKNTVPGRNCATGSVPIPKMSQVFTLQRRCPLFSRGSFKGCTRIRLTSN